MSVQFIEQIKAFEMLCDGLTAQAQILYYKLFKHNNYYGLGLPFYVTNEVLMHDSLIRNKQTFINARNTLIQRGFITYKSGKKGNPSVYQFIDLEPVLKGYKLYPKANQKRTESVPKANQKRTESVPKVGHNIAIAKAEDNAIAAAAREDVIRLFEDSIHPIANMVEKDALMDLIETDGYERVKDAIREAAMNRARSVKYIAAILGRWRKEGAREKRSSNSGTKNPEFAEQCRLADERQVYPWEVRPDA